MFTPVGNESVYKEKTKIQNDTSLLQSLVRKIQSSLKWSRL